MPENHIHIEDLLIREPRLQEEWKASDELLDSFLSDAFNTVCIELRRKSIDIDTDIVVTPHFFDGLIICKTLENFFTSKYRKDDDNAASRMRLYRDKYYAEFSIIVDMYEEQKKKKRHRNIRVGL